MKTAELTSIVWQKVKPLGATRKGRATFVLETADLLKVVDVQKSDFSQLCYLNYGFTLKSVPTDGLRRHVMKRPTSAELNVRARIDSLLDLESSCADTERTKGIEWIIDEFVLPEIMETNTEEDLKRFILSLGTLNVVPIRLREYYGL